jgi:outer membrane protein OmpA-like peptidoglycan-associated protein
VQRIKVFQTVTLTIFLILSFLISSRAFGEERSGNIKLSLSGGFLSLEDSADSLFGRTGLGINLSSYLSLDLSLTNSFSKNGVILISIDSSLDLLPEKRLSPFAVLGAGAGIISSDGSTTTKALFNAGIGLRYSLYKDVFLTLDIRDYILESSSRNWAASGGLVFYFDPVSTSATATSATNLDQRGEKKEKDQAGSRQERPLIEVRTAERQVAQEKTISEKPEELSARPQQEETAKDTVAKQESTFTEGKVSVGQGVSTAEVKVEGTAEKTGAEKEASRIVVKVEPLSESERASEAGGKDLSDKRGSSIFEVSSDKQKKADLPVAQPDLQEKRADMIGEGPASSTQQVTEVKVMKKEKLEMQAVERESRPGELVEQAKVETAEKKISEGKEFDREVSSTSLSEKPETRVIHPEVKNIYPDKSTTIERPSVIVARKEEQNGPVRNGEIKKEASKDISSKTEVAIVTAPSAEKTALVPEQVTSQEIKEETGIKPLSIDGNREGKKAEKLSGEQEEKTTRSGTGVSRGKDARMVAKKRIREKKVYEKAVLYGESSRQKQAGPEELSVRPQQEETVKDKGTKQESTLSQEERKDKQEIPVPEEEKVTIKKNRAEVVIEFNMKETSISPENERVLKGFVIKVKDKKPKRIIIEGHACAHGPKALNLIISKKRALSVKKFLRDHGIKKNVTVRFYGEERLRFKEIPTPDNINDPHVRANRRVRIIAYW